MKRSSIISSVAAACLVMCMAGCSNTGDKRLDEVRNNATPDLDTLYQRPVDMDSAVTVTWDEDGRMFWEDMGRFFLFDRPSRLTREIVPRP
jgi:hypothetical protein